MKKYIILLLLFSSVLFAEELTNKVIPLNYAKPEQIIPVLNPLLKSGERIQVYDHKLVVTASPETLTKINSMIQQLDVAPPIFLISIHQGDEGWLDNQDDIHYSTTSGQSQADNQAVQVENDSYAFISTGTDNPVISQVDIGWVTGVGYDRMKSQKGILVKPELQGNKVKIIVKHIYSQQNPVDQQSQQVSQSETTTIVALDKWIKIAQTGGSEYQSDDTIHYHAGKSFDTNGTLYIKVTLVNNN